MRPNVACMSGGMPCTQAPCLGGHPRTRSLDPRCPACGRRAFQGPVGPPCSLEALVRGAQHSTRALAATFVPLTAAVASPPLQTSHVSTPFAHVRQHAGVCGPAGCASARRCLRACASAARSRPRVSPSRLRGGGFEPGRCYGWHLDVAAASTWGPCHAGLCGTARWDVSVCASGSAACVRGDVLRCIQAVPRYGPGEWLWREGKRAARRVSGR